MNNHFTTAFKSIKFYIFALFVLAETAIYIAFNAISATTFENPVALKYSGIILCLLFSAVSCIFYGKDAFLITAALVFTAIADLFLFVLNDFYEIGVCSFIVVQLVYFARIYLTNGAKPYISLGVRLVLIGISLIALGATGNLNALTALSSIYLPLLLCNAAESLLLVKLSKKYILFFFGLILFIGCDICVGLSNFSVLGINFSSGALRFLSMATWAFYLPSQVLIVLSARKTDFKLFFAGGVGADEK